MPLCDHSSKYQYPLSDHPHEFLWRILNESFHIRPALVMICHYNLQPLFSFAKISMNSIMISTNFNGVQSKHRTPYSRAVNSKASTFMQDILIAMGVKSFYISLTFKKSEHYTWGSGEILGTCGSCKS